MSSEIVELEEDCKTCHALFEKDGIDFRPSMCHYCPVGEKLHALYCQQSESEKKWDKIDKNSFRYRQLVPV